METTYKPTAQEIKDLRSETDAPIMDCSRALVAASGNIEKAKKSLIDASAAKVTKKESRAANEGVIKAYVHSNGKVGVLLELNCETDFVAKNEKFLELAKDLTLQIAASKAMYANEADVPEDVKSNLLETFITEVANKPEHLREKITQGKLNKWQNDNVLMNQSFVKNEELKVHELVAQTTAVLGERIVVKRFVRYEMTSD